MRRLIKRYLPRPLRNSLETLRSKFETPPWEDVVLQQYEAVADPSDQARLSLVMPSIDPAWAFGGVTTGIDIFLELCHRSGAQPRIITEGQADRGVVDKRASALGLTPEIVENVRQPGQTARIGVRSSDIFITYNWWTTLNIRPLLDQQVKLFGGPARPFLYLIQDYEPSFYAFSSTHMLARLALEQERPCWGIFNSSQLLEFFKAQGHALERTYVFEPKVSNALRPALESPPAPKAKRVLVYGRPTIPRNCFPAVEKGLRQWAKDYPQFADWEVVSAGLAHNPIPIGNGRAVNSLGKLSLDAYADLLKTTAVGLSLMSSPHPSYPPLEMAHFSLLTITNRYANKDMARVHDNFISIPDIDAPTIAAALAKACETFEADPDAGWRGRSHAPSYVDPNPWAFLAELAGDLRGVWTATGAKAPPQPIEAA